MTYLEIINDPRFREANKLFHQAGKLLDEMKPVMDNKPQGFARYILKGWAGEYGLGSE